VIHCEVRLAQKNEEAEILCIFWKSSLLAPPAQPLYALHNETPVLLHLRQARKSSEEENPIWDLPGETACAFGFVRPNGRKTVELIRKDSSCVLLPSSDDIGSRGRIDLPLSIQQALKAPHILVAWEVQVETLKKAFEKD